nr:5765_t:CDS:2 [Entrophospora candida]
MEFIWLDLDTNAHPRWDRVMNVASSERGVQKMVDFILTYKKNTRQEIMYGEVSNGPFALSLKLGKLGKDSLNRINRIFKTKRFLYCYFTQKWNIKKDNDNYELEMETVIAEEPTGGEEEIDKEEIESIMHNAFTTNISPEKKASTFTLKY